MFQRLGYKLQEFMIGRNGPDDLSRFSLVLALVFIVLGAFVPVPFFDVVCPVLALAALGYSYWRICSRNLAARDAENRAYVSWRTKASAPFRSWYAHAKEWQKYHKTHRIFRCKSCGQSLRVPKGKGTVRVTCPKCKQSFMAKS